MKTYIVNQDIIWGFIPSLGANIVKPNTPNVVWKKGDKVSGVPKESFVGNKRTMVIEAKPTVKGAYISSSDGMAPISLDYLTEVTGSTNEPTTTSNNNSSSTTTNTKTDLSKVFLYVGIALVGYWLIKKM